MPRGTCFVMLHKSVILGLFLWYPIKNFYEEVRRDGSYTHLVHIRLLIRSLLRYFKNRTYIQFNMEVILIYRYSHVFYYTNSPKIILLNFYLYSEFFDRLWTPAYHHISSKCHYKKHINDALKFGEDVRKLVSFENCFLTGDHFSIKFHTTHTTWLADWLTAQLVDWLTGRLIDWLIAQLIDWLTGRLNDWPTGRLTDWPTDWSTNWSTGWLTDTPHMRPKNWQDNKVKIIIFTNWIVVVWRIKTRMNKCNVRNLNRYITVSRTP